MIVKQLLVNSFETEPDGEQVCLDSSSYVINVRCPTDLQTAVLQWSSQVLMVLSMMMLMTIKPWRAKLVSMEVVRQAICSILH